TDKFFVIPHQVTIENLGFSRNKTPLTMKILLISMVFFAPILAAPRPDAALEKAKHDVQQMVKAVENNLQEILGKDGYSKFERADYTGAVKSASGHNGETVNNTIKRIVYMFYENMKPFFTSKPGTSTEVCLKEFKES
ncbi:hypothetical protein QAD02_006351, partial [Eretmocerus hayati]